MPDRKYPLGFVFDHETGLIIPGVGGGLPEGEDGGAAGSDGAAEGGGAEAQPGGTGEPTAPGAEGGGDGGAEKPFLTPEERNLVGDKNIKSRADLIKSYVHGDAHIKRLEQERAEDRQVLLQAQADLEALREQGTTIPASPDQSPAPSPEDHEYNALWNAGKYREANALLAEKIANRITTAKLAESNKKAEEQNEKVARAQRVTEARGAIDRMSRDADNYPELMKALPHMQKYIDGKNQAWQGGFETVGEMFDSAYAYVAHKFPNLVNSGKGRAASAAGGGVGAGAAPGGAGVGRKPTPKVDAKMWLDLGLTPNPWQNERSSIDQADEDAWQREQNEAAKVG